MTKVCLYFQVHQPLRVKKYRIFDVGRDHNYFNFSGENNLNNNKVITKVSEKSYLPANNLIYELLKKYPKFRVSFSFSGVVIEQLKKSFPAVLKSFQKLIDTGRVEVLSETYYHSLAFFYSRAEFESQVELHKNLIEKTFSVVPKVFRNTELAYTNELARWADKMGYRAILAEGWDSFLGKQSPNFVYKPVGTKNIKLLLKNYKLSDDVAFRFSEKNWSEYPLTANKFASWILKINDKDSVVNLFMDYETFGEHQWADTGIFDFLKSLPEEILKEKDALFVTPSEASLEPPKGKISVSNIVTWADTERDLSAWMGNSIQKSALGKVYSMEKSLKELDRESLLRDWRRLQTSDHFYYMCTKWFSDGDVHKYFNPYESPYDAFISYMNALTDLGIRVKKEEIKHIKVPGSHNV